MYNYWHVAGAVFAACTLMFVSYKQTGSPAGPMSMADQLNIIALLTEAILEGYKKETKHQACISIQFPRRAKRKGKENNNFSIM